MKKMISLMLMFVIVISFTSAQSVYGDINGDGVVGKEDYYQVLLSWGTPNGDIDGDGTTSIDDFLGILEHWTPEEIEQTPTLQASQSPQSPQETVKKKKSGSACVVYNWIIGEDGEYVPEDFVHPILKANPDAKGFKVVPGKYCIVVDDKGFSVPKPEKVFMEEPKSIFVEPTQVIVKEKEEDFFMKLVGLWLK